MPASLSSSGLVDSPKGVAALIRSNSGKYRLAYDRLRGRGRMLDPLSDVTDRVLAGTKSGTTIEVSVLAKLSEACYDMRITKTARLEATQGMSVPEDRS